LAPIVAGVEKDVSVTRTVRAGTPIGKFLLMAFLASRHHLKDVLVPETRSGRCASTEMSEDAAHVVDMKVGLHGENIAVTIRARHVAVRRGVPIGIGLPDLMTTGTSASVRALVLSGNAQQ